MPNPRLCAGFRTTGRSLQRPTNARFLAYIPLRQRLFDPLFRSRSPTGFDHAGQVAPQAPRSWRPRGSVWTRCISAVWAGESREPPEACKADVDADHVRDVHPRVPAVRQRPSYEQKATLELSGTVDACSAHSMALTNAYDLGKAGEGTPTFRPGKQITVGRFGCRILTDGVRCTLTTSGRGFLFTPTTIVPVGGATVRKAPVASS